MKIVYLMSSLSRANGGVSESVRRLAQAVARTQEVGVVGLRDTYTEADRPLWSPLQPRDLPVCGPRSFGYATGFLDAIEAEQPEVAHAAGLWMYPSVAQRTWSRRRGRPYLISPHGMLDDWALKNSAWKKKLAGCAFERRHLTGAACLHALCAAEADAIRAYGLTNPICVIPNGVDLPGDTSALPPPAWRAQGRRTLLFLGRLHPKKGLVPLLQAWAKARPSGWQLVIAGWDQGGHQAELERLAQQHALTREIIFAGPLHGADKAAAYAHADAFILPSFSEGLPMTVLEAWSHRLPVLMTDACNLPEGFSAGAASRITTDPAALADDLARFCARSDTELEAVGENGRALVARDFNWDRIA